MGPKFSKILECVNKIPAGKVATYGDVAYAAGFPGEARIVAFALNAEIHRCQWPRVVGAEGKILLEGERGFEQRLRLQQEGVEFIGLRVNMRKCRHSFFSK